MVNYLKNCKKTTLIGQLPDIINSNNSAIKAEFDQLFDSSYNRLKKSVYAPGGSVKAHFGEFVNLSCEYLTVKNTDSMKNSIQNAVNEIVSESFDSSMQVVLNHQLLNNRFINESDLSESGLMHDAAAIVYKKEDDNWVTVDDALNNLFDIIDKSDIRELINEVDNVSISLSSLTESYTDYVVLTNNKIENLNSSIQISDASINTIEKSIQTINSSIQSLSYKGMPYNKFELMHENIVRPNEYNVYTGDFSDGILFIKNERAEERDVVNEYIMRFTCMVDDQVVEFEGGNWRNNNIIWEFNNKPTFVHKHVYEIRIIDNFGSYKEYENN